MVDYTVGIGGSSTMMIRDTGGWVEFWFQTGPSTWNNGQTWSYSANGVYSGVQKFRLLRGGAWQHLGSVYVTYDQDIQFTMYDTGIGFPTHTFTQHIQRTTVPQPPTMRQVTPISSTAFHVVFQGNYDGGSAVVEWQIGYGSSSNGPTATVASGGTSDVGGFSPGQKVYFWARGRNALGWSAWSARGEGTTWQNPDAPVQPLFKDISQTSVGVSFLFGVRAGNPPLLEKQIGYSTDPLGVSKTLVTYGASPTYIYNLTPGGTYYFWGRARNSVGWGPWSVSSRVMLIAGAKVLVSGQWRRAVPYVKDGGTWKVAEPWVRNQGKWKKTAT